MTPASPGPAESADEVPAAGAGADTRSSTRRPLHVGLTGNIGSGKSSVARRLVGLGAALIDSDVLARQAAEDPLVLSRIADEIGRQLVVRGGDGRDRLDRAGTAALVFEDEAALARLTGLIHPWVRQRSAELAQQLAARQDPPQVIVFDIPLLYENGLEQGLDAVIVVTAPLATRLARVVARSGASGAEARAAAEADAAARDARQLPLTEKAARADFVIDNSGSVAELEEQTARLWDELLALGRAAG